MRGFMALRKITLLLFIGLLSVSACGAIELEVPKESKVDITASQRLSFKEKTAQVKATIATFMRKHKKTLIITVIVGVMAFIANDHYQQRQREQRQREREREREHLQREREREHLQRERERVLHLQRERERELERERREREREREQVLERLQRLQEQVLQRERENFLEKNKYTADKVVEKDIKIIQGQNTCPFCLNDFSNCLEDLPNNEIILTCNHRYHIECINMWASPYINDPSKAYDPMNSPGACLCPICREPLKLTGSEKPELINIATEVKNFLLASSAKLLNKNMHKP
jgi:hypothetical protein